MEQYAHIDTRWQISDTSVGVLGYQFGYVTYSRRRIHREHAPRRDHDTALSVQRAGVMSPPTPAIIIPTRSISDWITPSVPI